MATKKSKPAQVDPRDRETPERARRVVAERELTHVDGEGRKTLARAISDAPLDRLHARCQLDEDEGNNRRLWAAGDQYRTDWELAHSSDLPPQQWELTGHSGATGAPPAALMQERVYGARRRFEAATRALPATDKAMAQEVLLGNVPLAEAAKRWTRYRTPRTAREAGSAVILDRLARVLDVLARFYHRR